MCFGRKFLIVVLAAVVLAGCGSSEKTEDVEGPLPEQTTTSTTIDIRSRNVPEHPDVAYVSAVLKELEHVRGDIRRDVFATHSMSQATYDRIDDIYDQRQGDIAKKIWSEASMKDHPDAQAIPGDEKLENIDVLDSKNGCVVLAAVNDNSAVVRNPPTPRPKFVFEIRVLGLNNRDNPTPWKLTYESEYDASKLAGYTCDEY
jgi:hypothetical protein